MMKKGKLRYLGFLGFIGLGGLITGNYGMFGFFGFFAFFGASLQQQDEMLRHNLARAGLNGFVISMLGLSASILVVTMLESWSYLALMVGITFAAQILTFTFSLIHYERKGGVFDDH